MPKTRTDCHSPKNIEPDDYRYLTVVYNGTDPEITMMLGDTKKDLWDMMDRNGWKYGKNHSAGSCFCCGAHANYRGAFLHIPKNEVVFLGENCMYRVNMGNKRAFDTMRRRAKDAREYKKGKMKADAIIEDMGVAFDKDEIDRVRRVPSGEIDPKSGEFRYYSREERAELISPGCPAYHAFRHKGDADTISDLFHNLVKYGSWSEKQEKFFRSLLERFNSFDPDSLRKKEEDRVKKVSAVHMKNGRQEVSGEVVTLREPDVYDSFPAWKMLVVRKDGWKFWGTRPAALSGVEKGDQVHFMANVTIKEAGFAFFSRPTKAEIL